MSKQHQLSVIPSVFILLIIHHIQESVSEEINCDNDWSQSLCHNKKISCNANSTTCSINCNGDGSCDGATLNCNTNTNAECNIKCNGKQSCRGTATQSVIHCPSNANCNIYCNGAYSCDEIDIHCPKSANCTIHANGDYSLVNADILCPNKGQCLINCNNILSCYDARFDGRNTSQLTIHCANNKNACKNMQVGCPKAINNTKRCQINGDEGTVHDGINLYAINSWDDIDLSKFVGKTGRGDNTHKPWMHCGIGFRDECVISYASWNCRNDTFVCYRDGINAFPTSLPTKQPTHTPSKAIENWAAIFGLIVGVFFFCLFVILGWVWCVKKQQHVKTKYETLDQAPDPDADIMQKEHQHMYRTDIPNNKNPMDVVTNSGLHIVNDYSDASKCGGLLPISEETRKEFLSKSNIIEEKKESNTEMTVVEDGNDEAKCMETDKLILENEKQDSIANIKQNKARNSNEIE